MARSKMIKVESESAQKMHIALYVRCSTDAQAEEGYSIPIQIERTRNYAMSQNGEIESIEEYVDDGYTGANMERPQLERLMRDVADGKLTHVIVYKLDRLSRSQKDTLYLIEDVFIPSNVAFISVTESFNTATPFGRAVIGILSVFAQLERETIYDRTRNGMKKRVENGFWMGGGMVPFGYDYDQNQGILVPNKDADTVRQAYQMYINGASEGTIAERLGFKYDRLVHQILTRVTNTGVIPYNGEVYPGRHEAIVSKETYDLAMRLMHERSQRRLTTQTQYLLTGLLECGCCGAKMRHQKWGSPDNVKVVCYSRHKSKPYLVKDPHCDNSIQSKDDIEAIVLADVFAMTGNLDTSDVPAVSTSVLDSLREQEMSTNKKIEKLYNLYASTDNSDHLLDVIRSLQESLKDIRSRIEREELMESEYRQAVNTKTELRNLQDIWDNMTQQERISAIRSLVEKIIVTHENIEIIYKI